jgi:hypothetical protein
MKLYRILFLVPALLLQLGCGNSSTPSSTNNAYMSNGVCYLNGQPTAQTACTYSATGNSQLCSGTYYQCNQGTQYGAQGCQPGNCTANPDNCRGLPNLYTLSQYSQTLTPVTCP